MLIRRLSSRLSSLIGNFGVFIEWLVVDFFCSLPKRFPSVEFSHWHLVSHRAVFFYHHRAWPIPVLCPQMFVGLILRFVANVDLIVRRVGIDVKRLSLLPNGRHLSFGQRLEFLPLFNGGRDLRFETG